MSCTLLPCLQFKDDGIVQNAVSRIRKNFGDGIVIMTDVCLCQFTSTGHCGITQNGKIDNDSSIDTPARIAVSQAKAGADMIVTYFAKSAASFLQEP